MYCETSKRCRISDDAESYHWTSWGVRRVPICNLMIGKWSRIDLVLGLCGFLVHLCLPLQALPTLHGPSFKETNRAAVGCNEVKAGCAPHFVGCRSFHPCAEYHDHGRASARIWYSASNFPVLGDGCGRDTRREQIKEVSWSCPPTWLRTLSTPKRTVHIP